MSFVEQYLQDAVTILQTIDRQAIERMIEELVALRARGGRLFLLGVGGSAGNCGHAVNDFRKLAGIETYAPTDNVAELTARTNDEGWSTVFAAWLKVSRLTAADAVLVFSVGGGSKEKDISANIVCGLEFARAQRATILGIVGRDGGFTAQVARACIIVPTVNAETLTPHAEAFQGVLWHLIIADPRLMQIKNKWESVANF